MSPRSAGSSPSGPFQQEPGAHATAAEPIGTSVDSGFEVESLLPFGRTTSGATYTYSESLESRSDPPEDSLNPELVASTPAYQDDAGGAGLQQHVQKESTLHQKVKGMLACEPLLLATIFGVLLGILAGSLIRLGKPSSKAIDLIGFPGEIMLRLLKMLVLPLVAGSMIAGVCSLRGSTSSMAKVARWTLMYYAATTVTAVVLGMVLVTVVKPGRGSPLNGDVVSCGDTQAAAPIPADFAEAVQQRTPLDALLDVARNMFPDNVAAAAVNMNILGVITFSLFFGLCLSMVGEDAEPMIKLVDSV
ncbi:hypothetical protein ABBQ38_012464 [Trebouxia sp. C0009 RCD-2024]